MIHVHRYPSPKTFLIVALLSLPIVLASLLQAEDKAGPPPHPVSFQKHVLNADSRFETAGIGDIDGDGKKDVMCGGFWYVAPDWQPHRVGTIEESSGYHNDFANHLQDVDGDGDLDVISVTWFSQEILWRENPGAKGGDWPTHTIDKPGNVETALFADLSGDGVDDIVPNIMGEVAWYEYMKDPAGGPKWIKHTAGQEGAGHGIGVGDVNQDGQWDIICPKGWYEVKKENSQFTYRWHAEFDLGSTSVPILAHDVNEDGQMDLIWGYGHDYGLFWAEQRQEDSKRTWTIHVIDKSWSQPHCLLLADLDGDCRAELITGKRYWAHNGNDPGENDPRCIYYYSFTPKSVSWTRHTIDEGTTAAFGLLSAADDIDGDGDIDLACPGKSGLYVFENLRIKK
ncbi:MAG TPA: VCBS repeat-containing protein [bacterium]|nr:VCBS repeat-containing protein [Candidatus Omnitrophota bacterium]HOJ59292.1 VCBS repeat-containing protein [bacterium]HPO99805.1 VCBS repeat-containing protein [bacterium]